MSAVPRTGLAVLGGRLIVVSRMDGGDGTCNEDTASYCEKQPWWGGVGMPHFSNYRITSR